MSRGVFEASFLKIWMRTKIYGDSTLNAVGAGPVGVSAAYNPKRTLIRSNDLHDLGDILGAFWQNEAGWLKSGIDRPDVFHACFEGRRVGKVHIQRCLREFLTLINHSVSDTKIGHEY